MQHKYFFLLQILFFTGLIYSCNSKDIDTSNEITKKNIHINDSIKQITKLTLNSVNQYELELSELDYYDTTNQFVLLDENFTISFNKELLKLIDTEATNFYELLYLDLYEKYDTIFTWNHFNNTVKFFKKDNSEKVITSAIIKNISFIDNKIKSKILEYSKKTNLPILIYDTPDRSNIKIYFFNGSIKKIIVINTID